VGSLCYDFSNLEKFLNQKSVRESLGVGDIEFVSCSPTVYQAMLLDWMRNLELGIPELLEDNIKVLIYAGEYDLICNWLGEGLTSCNRKLSGTVRYNLLLFCQSIHHSILHSCFTLRIIVLCFVI
jgi:carboxypeptidase C (cathepsin A)